MGTATITERVMVIRAIQMVGHIRSATRSITGVLEISEVPKSP